MGAYLTKEEVEAVELEEMAKEPEDLVKANIEAQERKRFEVGSIEVNGFIKQHVKANKSSFIHNLVYLDGERFSFDGRSYLLPIYNGKYPRLVLKFARQNEKCVASDSIVETPSGKGLQASLLKPGDKILTLDFNTLKPIEDEIVASENNGVKECVRIKTVLGKEVIVTLNHPLLGSYGWIDAGCLSIKNRIYTVSGLEEIVEYENIGPIETWAIQTKTETYLSDGIVNHNSTFLANSMIVDSAVKPYHKSVYVSPSYLQTRQFSAGKLTPWMEDSPVISKYLLSSKVSNQVFEKGMTNGSMIFLRSAFLNADRIRGLSASTLCIDEVQSMISANLPVIMEVLSHSPDPTAMFSGTPLTNDNILEQLWQDSSQCEWLVPCTAHTPYHWNFLDERCVGLKGPICNKCGKPINPGIGKWVAFTRERYTMGFHLNQIMVPWMQHPDKWREIVHKLNTYPKGLFYNEVLGISYDSASKPITRMELMGLCSQRYPMKIYPDTFTQSHDLFMGVDWGTGSDGSERDEKGKLKTASYTIAVIGCYINPKQFHVMYFKRFKGDEAIPSNCIREIIRIGKSFNVRMVGADWGFGWAANDQLENAFGQNKVIKWQHIGMQRERMKYDPVGHKMQISRTEVMSDFFADLKRQNYVFPPWEVSQEYLVDIEHIFAEQTSIGHLKYDHKKTEPDDVAHAVIFARETADHYHGRKR